MVGKVVDLLNKAVEERHFMTTADNIHTTDFAIDADSQAEANLDRKLFQFERSTNHVGFEFALAIGQTRFSKEWELLQLSIGNDHQVSLDLRSLTRDLCNREISNMILCHNHPNGNPLPSRRDLSTTRIIAQICQAVCTVLNDHIIISSEGLYSFRHAGHL